MTVYALLVGIDEYAGPIAGLQGCKADVDAIQKVLESRIPLQELNVRRLVDAKATRSALIDGFRQHFNAATSGDVLIFWYAGHGSRQPTASGPGAEPDGFDETLVLHDSRASGGSDLADKELASLIREVARPGVHVFVGLDCCHSGSGTREVLPEDVAIRRAPADSRVRARSASDYLTPPDQPGRHVLLTGCRSDQTSKEVRFAGIHRGAMTSAVERALGDAGPSMTYRELHRTVRAAVAQVARDQVPQLETTDSLDAETSVFNGALSERIAGYLITFDGANWMLDAGAVQGISLGTGEAVTRLEIRDPASGEVLARAHLSAVNPGSSVAVLDEELDTDRSYRAVIVAVPLPQVAVSVAADMPMVRDAVDGSPYLSAADVGDISLRTSGGGIDIVDAARGPDPVAHVADDPAKAVAAVEKIVRWRQIVDLDNPGSGLAGVVLEVRRADAQGTYRLVEPGPGGEILLDYDEETAPSFVLAVRNEGPDTVFCGVVALGEDYSVTTLLPGSVARLEAGAVTSTNAIRATVPNDLWREGVSRRTDVVKVIASGADFDPELLVQGGLSAPAATRDAGNVSGPPSSTLARLLNRVQNRELSPIPGPEPVVDWTTSSVRIITERRQPGTAVGGVVQLAAGVSLEAPAGLTATASLTGSEVVARDLIASMVPPMLIDEPDHWEPLSLVPTRGTSGALDVLELNGVQGGEVVTPTNPMTMTLDGGLAESDSVIVIGFDGRNYLPVGHSVRSAGPGATIRIEQLPPAIPTRGVIDARSLGGSIRLLFRRFVRKLTGGSINVTRLAVPTVGTHDVHYDDDPVNVAAAVAGADRILLLIHGILGDTAGMAIGGAHGTGGVTGFGTGYDLVLTFDYENINTPIDVTAAELRRKLVDAGVQSKQLDIVAHSMGGLVARWMIEQDESGLVDRLITAGTPNGGSPWPVLQGWATAALAFGLNKLQTVFWPASVLSGLVALVEGVDEALDDMAPSSARLAELFGSPDPGVRYTVLLGDRSLIGDVQQQGRAAEILRALTRIAIDATVAVAFLKQPNDLAVSVESARHLPTNRTPRVDVKPPVACDHITFFSSAAGLAALAAAVGESPGAGGT